MKTMSFILFLMLAPSVGLTSAPFKAWQTSSAWVDDSLPAAIKSRATWFALQVEPKYNESNCPYPGDAEFRSQALPVFASSPAIYATYTTGQPEMFLTGEQKTVYYPIHCNDGATGFIEMSDRGGTWKAVSHHLATPGNAFTDLFSFKSDDLKQSHLTPQNYFAVLILPVSVGGKPFPGAIFLARETATEFDMKATYDVEPISVQRGTWTPADQVMQKLKAYQDHL